MAASQRWPVRRWYVVSGLAQPVAIPESHQPVSILHLWNTFSGDFVKDEGSDAVSLQYVLISLVLDSASSTKCAYTPAQMETEERSSCKPTAQV